MPKKTASNKPTKATSNKPTKATKKAGTKKTNKNNAAVGDVEMNQVVDKKVLNEEIPNPNADQEMKDQEVNFHISIQKRYVFHILCVSETSYPGFTPLLVRLLLYSWTGCDSWIFRNFDKSTFTLKNYSKLQKRQNHQNEEIKKMTRSYLFYFLHFGDFGVFGVLNSFLRLKWICRNS